MTGGIYPHLEGMRSKQALVVLSNVDSLVSQSFKIGYSIINTTHFLAKAACQSVKKIAVSS